MNMSLSSLRLHTRRLLALCVLLLCVASCLSASASLRPASAAARQAPTTPALIDQAFARGEISSDQRLLYLVYAVYDFGRLPAQFRGRPGWSATMVVREINQVRQALASGAATFSPELRAALQSARPQAATVCDTEDGPSTLDTTHFHIVYGAINGLTAQQYADAIEATFATEITSYGWAEPPLSNNNPFGKYPVQVSDIGDQVYGYVTSPGGNYTGTVGDNPNTPAVETSALASCMVVNSNMLQFANSGPAAALLALKVTMAHEYFHAVQYGNGDPDPAEQVVWYESTAAYVEDEVLPTAHDNYQYLYPNLTVGLPMQQDNNAQSSMWPLFRYAAERNGGLNTAAGGAALMKAMWASIGAGQPAIKAYDDALKAKGTSLNTTFHDFAISMRFMKGCASAAPYCFSDGAGILAGLGSLPTDQGAVATVGGSYTGMVSNTYAANWVGLPSSGAYSIQLNNTSSGGILHASVVANMGDSLVVTALPGLATANNSTSLASYTVPTGATSVVLVITNEQISADLGALGVDSYQVSTGAAVAFDHFVYLPSITR
jgi:hypothetical protein